MAPATPWQIQTRNQSNRDKTSRYHTRLPGKCIPEANSTETKNQDITLGPLLHPSLKPIQQIPKIKERWLVSQTVLKYTTYIPTTIIVAKSTIEQHAIAPDCI